MSFLLDALRSLERKNRPGSVPGLFTIHETAPGKPKRTKLLVCLAAAILLLNGTVLLALLWIRQSKSPERPFENEQASQQISIESGSLMRVSSTPLLTAVSSPEPPEAESMQPKPLEENTVIQPETALRESPECETANKSDDKPDVIPETHPIEEIDNDREKAEMASPDEGPREERLVEEDSPGEDRTPLDEVCDLEALSVSVRAELKDLVVSGHIYSDEPDLRMAVVNNNVTREGERVTGDLKLMEITPEGTVFSYRNYRFLIRKK